jgi:hypothetical protein
MSQGSGAGSVRRKGDTGVGVSLFAFNKPGRAAWIAALAFGLAALAGVGGAAAMPTCEGTYAATLLQPLPTPMVVGLDVRDDSPANRRMADRFLAGLREAGVAVGAPPNVLLTISSSRLGVTSGQQGGGAEEDLPDLAGIEEGGLQPTAPGLPNLPRPTGLPSRPRLLGMRIEATAGQTMQIVWVASVQCRIIGTDDGQRAQDMGRAIGAALGQRIERRPL